MEKLDILELIEQKKYIQLKKELSEMNEVDISEILDPLDLQTTLLVLGCFQRIRLQKSFLIFHRNKKQILLMR